MNMWKKAANPLVPPFATMGNPNTTDQTAHNVITRNAAHQRSQSVPRKIAQKVIK